MRPAMRFLPLISFLAVFLFSSVVYAGNIKVALLPIPDSLPCHVAEVKGYFKELGLEVTYVPIASAIERDQLMQAGRIDGMLTEMSITAGFNKDKPRIKILQIARRPMGEHALFTILAKPKSAVKSLQDLAGVPIGVSVHTIIEYVTDRLMQAAGVPDEKILSKSVPSIPERFQLLMQGRIEAAVMPEPLATAAIQAGAVKVESDASHPFYSASVLAFSNESLDKKKKDVAAFLSAWNKAAEEINKNPEACRNILMEKVRIPPDVQKTFPIPTYPVAEIPSQAQWDDVIAWMLAKKLLTAPLAYEDNVRIPEKGESTP